MSSCFIFYCLLKSISAFLNKIFANFNSRMRNLEKIDSKYFWFLKFYHFLFSVHVISLDCHPRRLVPKPQLCLWMTKSKSENPKLGPKKWKKTESRVDTKVWGVDVKKNKQIWCRLRCLTSAIPVILAGKPSLVIIDFEICFYSQ